MMELCEANNRHLHFFLNDASGLMLITPGSSESNLGQNYKIKVDINFKSRKVILMLVLQSVLMKTCK